MTSTTTAEQTVECPRCKNPVALIGGRLDRHTVDSRLDAPYCQASGDTPEVAKDEVDVDRVLAATVKALPQPSPDGLRFEFHPSVYELLARSRRLVQFQPPEPGYTSIWGVPLRPNPELPERGWRLVVVLAEGAAP